MSVLAVVTREAFPGALYWRAGPQNSLPTVSIHRRTWSTDVRITAVLAYLCIRPRIVRHLLLSQRGPPLDRQVKASDSESSSNCCCCCGHVGQPTRTRQVLWLRYRRAGAASLLFPRPYRDHDVSFVLSFYEIDLCPPSNLQIGRNMCREKTDRTKNRVLNEFGMVDDSDRDVTQGRWCRASEVKKTKSRPNENKSRLGKTVYREYCRSLTKTTTF